MPIDKFDEYKLFIDDTARFTDRRQTVNNTYVTINSIMLTAVSFLVKDAGLDQPRKFWAATAILIGGLATCLQWNAMISKYKDLIRIRFEELRKMEELPEMAGCCKMYHAEDVLFPRDRQGSLLDHVAHNISDAERMTPLIFGAIYLVFLVGCILAYLRTV